MLDVLEFIEGFFSLRCPHSFVVMVSISESPSYIIHNSFIIIKNVLHLQSQVD